MSTEETLTKEDSLICEQWVSGDIDDKDVPSHLRSTLGISEDESELEEEEFSEGESDLEVDTDPNENTESEPKSEDASNPPEEKERTPLKGQLYNAQNELNRYKQKYSSLEKKLSDPTELKKYLDSKGIDVSDIGLISKEDKYSDETLDLLIDSANKNNVHAESTRRAKEVMSREHDNASNAYSDIQGFQDEFEEFRTDMSIIDIDEKMNALGGTVSKVKAVENGISESDFEKFKEIGSIYSGKTKSDYKKMRSYYLENGGDSKLKASNARSKIEAINEDRKKELKGIPRAVGGLVSSDSETNGNPSEASMEKLMEKADRLPRGMLDLNPNEQRILNDFLERE